MKTLIQLEELLQFALGIFAFSQLSFAWWWLPVLILAPDISCLGYIFGNKIGAVTYNLFHHKGVAIAVFVTGYLLQDQVIELAGVILFTHSAMDRTFGYGLKTFEGFKHTHLGMIGK